MAKTTGSKIEVFNSAVKETTKIKEEEKDDLLIKVQDRFIKMKSERAPFEAEWDYIDAQVNSKSFYDNDGRLIVNTTVEQTLLEIHKGRTSGKINFDVQSVGVQPDNQEEKSAKYVLNDFIDRENFWKEYETWEYDRAKYGTGIFANFMQMDRVKNYAHVKGDVEDKIGNGYYEKKMIESYEEKRKFTPRNRPIRQIYIDDGAVWQCDKDKIKDIILVETLDIDNFKIRFDNKIFNIEGVEPLASDDQEYGIQNTKDKVVIWYYYDIINKDYCIVANKEHKVFQNKITEKCLPISIAPFRFRSDCIYGYGLPRIVRTSKRYKNMILQAMVDGALLASRTALIMGNTDWVDGEPQMSQLVNTWRTTGSVDQVQPLNLSNNLNYLTSVLQIIEQEIRTDTGIDPQAMFEAPAEQLGTVEIIEENKAIRYKSIDQSRDLALDDAMTQALNNITTYAPVLLRKVETIDGVKVTKQRPIIKVPNIKVVNKDGKRYFEEDYGNYGHFELKPKTETGDLIVRIVTPSSLNNNSVALSKNRNKEFMANLTTFAQVYGPEAVMNVAPFEEVRRMTKQDYGYGDKLTPDTRLDLNKKEQLDKMEAIKTLVGLNMGNETTNQQQIPGANQQVPGTPGAQGQVQSSQGQLPISPAGAPGLA